MPERHDLPATPGQTIGPFYGFALPYPHDAELVPPGTAGAVRLHGSVLDGAGEPVPDALLEVRQADSLGRIPAVEGSLRRGGGPFTGWGRCAVDDGGRYAFTTVEPAATDAGSLAFFAVTVFARGLLNRLFTRVYLPLEEQAAGLDGLLTSLPVGRRDSLVARRDDAGDLAWDVRLQGAGETVFLDFPRHEA